MDELPTASAPEELQPEQEPMASAVDETQRIEAADVLAAETRLLNDETRRLDDETRLLNEETRLLDGETHVLDGETQLLPREEGPAEPDDDSPDELDDMPAVAATGVIPVDETLLRPLPKEEQDLHLRRTRDYDHDAQSVNTVASADNFDTIQERSSKKVRRDPYARSARKGRVPGEGNSRSKLRPLLAIFLIALVLGAAGAVLTYGMELWGGKSVPAVVGESQAYAEDRLAEKGFAVRVEAVPADDAIGKVVSQDPEVGTRLPEGSKVTIVIATNRIVPEVVGLMEDEARALLTEAGAEKIETTSKPSSEAAGTVIAVSPEAGKAFVAYNPITLTLATPFTVPDVIGKKESDAVAAIKDAGLNAEVSYIDSDKTVRTVVETSPGAGETIEEGGTVQVKVSTPFPSDPQHLAEFFKHSSQDVDTYLKKKGYSFKQGFVDSYGNALAYYESGELGNVTFSSQPYSRWLALPKKDSGNVMEAGTPFAGVRLDFPWQQVPTNIDRSGVEQLAKQCGFGEIEDFCDNQSMVVPAGSPQASATFACGSGKSGELVWTILIAGNSSSLRAVATCAKESIYKDSDLQPFGGSVCKFVAYQEVYLSSGYQAVQPKHDEKKEGENVNANG